MVSMSEGLHDWMILNMKMNIRKLAKIAECSPATVSRVLSGNHGNVPISPKTREKIVKICKEYDYEPNIHASRMFSKRSGIIGLVTSGTSVEDANLSRFISGVYDKLSAKEARLMLLASDEEFLNNKEYLTVFKRREVDALIIWGVYGNTAWLDEMFEAEYPFILASNRHKDYPSVVCDDLIGMKKLVKQCVKKGAKRFVYVDGGDMEVSHRRRNAFLEVAKGYEIEVIEGDYTVESGVAAVENMAGDLPDAIFCVNDLTAMGVIKGLKRAEVAIPDDVMVAGVDGINLSLHTDPPLSTYDQMPGLCGTKCVDILFEFLEKKKAMRSQVVAPEIHLRESTFL